MQDEPDGKLRFQDAGVLLKLLYCRVQCLDEIHYCQVQCLNESMLQNFTGMDLEGAMLMSAHTARQQV